MHLADTGRRVHERRIVEDGRHRAGQRVAHERMHAGHGRVRIPDFGLAPALVGLDVTTTARLIPRAAAR